MPSTGPLIPQGANGDDVMNSADRSVRPATYPKAIAVVATVASLYFGRDIFIPLAVAVLLTFALAPLVSFLRKFHLPRPVAAVAVVIGAFASIFLFGAVVASQLGTLAENLPTYQNNIETKVKAIKGAYAGEGVFDRISKLFDRLGREIQSEEAAPVPRRRAGGRYTQAAAGGGRRARAASRCRFC